jgi:RHS repeat-associated protein
LIGSKQFRPLIWIGDAASYLPGQHQCIHKQQWHGGDATSCVATTSTATTSTAAQGTPPLVSRRNYTGQILDATGLLFYNARYYDPGIGRFLSADTVVPGAPSGTMSGVAVAP